MVERHCSVHGCAYCDGGRGNIKEKIQDPRLLDTIDIVVIDIVRVVHFTKYNGARGLVIADLGCHTVLM